MSGWTEVTIKIDILSTDKTIADTVASVVRGTLSLFSESDAKILLFTETPTEREFDE